MRHISLKEVLVTITTTCNLWIADHVRPRLIESPLMRESLPVGVITGGQPDLRCIYPNEGRRFETLMAGRDAPTIARAVGISPEIVRAYRRGHAKPSPVTKAKLEQFFGATLDPYGTKVETDPKPKFNTEITTSGDTFVMKITGKIVDLPSLGVSQ